MRSRSRIIQALLASAVVLGGAALALFTTGEGQRPAQAVGDLPPAGAAEIPNVLLLYDSSGSQNEGIGSANQPNNFLGCFRGQVKRYMPFQLVLTGRFTDTGGGSGGTTTIAPPVTPTPAPGDSLCDATLNKCTAPENCWTCASQCGCKAALGEICSPYSFSCTTCGNGLVEGKAGETCDWKIPGSCPTECPDDGDECTNDVLTGSPETCNAVCSHVAIPGCAPCLVCGPDGDGCCPLGCSSKVDTDCLCSAGYKVGNEWITLEPDGTVNTGLLGAHATDMWFGLSGVDQKDGTGTDSAGGFSYAPDRGTDVHKYSWNGTEVVDLGVVDAVVNQGMRNRGATEFPLIPHYQLKDPANPSLGSKNIVEVNQLVRLALAPTTFGSNGSGLMDVFDDAYHYWMNDFPEQPGAEAACGDKYIIYLMGGLPGPTDYTHAVQAVERLRDAGIVTYVVTLVDVNQPESKTLPQMAYADAIAEAGGGTCASDEKVYGESYGHCAFIALSGACPHDDANCDVSGARDLHTKLGAVLNLILNQSTSRTRAAVVNAPLLSRDDTDGGGQWRVNATFQMSDIGGAWHGFMAATNYVIAPDGAIVECTGDPTLDPDDVVCEAPLKFDQLLDAGPYDDRVIYTTDTTGDRVTLDAFLRAEPQASAVAALYATYRTLHPCLAEAFFGGTPPVEQWIDMLRGEQHPVPEDPEAPPPIAACNPASYTTATEQNRAITDWKLVRAYQSTKLGDIYHSSPIVVGPPELYINDPTYLSFLLDNEDRPTMVYVGANDGMLHAFYLRHTTDTMVGKEAWAWVPPAAVPRLHERIDGERPTLLFDGPIIARDVQRPRPTTETDLWRTVLIAASGRAHKQYIALDVTDPADPRPLWIFPREAADEALLAKSVASPTIGRVFINTGAGDSTSLVERPVAFIPGGFNPPTHAETDTTGRVFYVIDLFTGEVIKRFSNEDTGSVDVPLDAPISGTPAAYMDLPTTFTTRVFVGDYKGRMWRIDTSSPNVADWKMTRFFPAQNDPTYDTPTYQRPIYLAPAVALDWARRPIVYYGTGNLDSLSTEAGQTPLPNWFFGVREEQSSTGGVYGNLLDDSTLDERFPIELIGGTTADPALETLVGDPVVFNGVVLFTTFMDTGLCGFGEGRLYGVDYLTGAPRLYQDSTTGATRLTYAGDEAAQSYLSLGGGVPSTPLIRQMPADVSFTPTGPLPDVKGGQFEAIVQMGASGRTEDTGANTMDIDLGSVPRHADVQSVSNLECL